MDYRVEVRQYTYTYRSYQACEDMGKDDCVGTGNNYVVYCGKRQLQKTFLTRDQADTYIATLKKRRGLKK